MVWGWVLRWLHPRGGREANNAQEDTLTNETLMESKRELNRLENDIVAITGALCRCEEMLTFLFRKEVQLREGFEAILMEMHDTVSGEWEETIKKNMDNIGSLQQLLRHIQQNREQLQDWGYRLHVKLQYLKEEKKSVAKSADILLSRLLGGTSFQQVPVAENDDDDDGGWRPVVAPPPVMVRFVEEYRDEEESKEEGRKHLP
ncbi:uncharacterized protein Tco025E_00700 [Trypanosoma conorhini]|uniref:Uncharacterized protein n=1 Tax=Trypanosoma conorhini TaxID=83891 RepID=A0A422QAK9_9TRYP|nr:uncharacterized protein Tco025E_00700 [Trypanosoma conorhini]RNF27016.1 hypothetical protein Tco025E_00700 [Trypanosoma conorhini]